MAGLSLSPVSQRCRNKLAADIAVIRLGGNLTVRLTAIAGLASGSVTKFMPSSIARIKIRWAVHPSRANQPDRRLKAFPANC